VSFPVAHGLLGASVVAALSSNLSVKRDWKLLMLGASAAILPDFDYFLLVRAFGMNPHLHRGFSHSLTFALLTGVVISLLFAGASLKQALIFWAATASHGILDLFSKGDPVEILWPFSRSRYDLGVAPYYHMSAIRQGPLAEALLYMAKVCVLEFAIFAPLLILILFVKRPKYNKVAAVSEF
jgi:membrane-bound metal-dependent hydrolase YbcI (DUF457 family)